MATAPAAALNCTLSEQPARRALSLRRTSSLQTWWPAGPPHNAAMSGRLRDLHTPAPGAQPVVVGSDWLEARLDLDKRLASLDASRHSDVVTGFAGLSPGGPMRKTMAATMPDEGVRTTRLHRMLDDMAGANFMATAAWYAWASGLEAYHAASGAPSFQARQVMRVCLSYTPGSYALTAQGTVGGRSSEGARRAAIDRSVWLA